jgi:hypothetical protein
VIRRLRRRHRLAWLLLAVLLPLAYALALRSRQPPPIVESMPQALAREASP